MNDATGKTPWHLWLVGILGLLYNGVGGKNYLDVREGAAEFRAEQAEAFGTTPEIVAAYYDNYALWADICYALGVWWAVAGAILLLLRSRFAKTAFWISLIGFVGNLTYGTLYPIEGMQNVGLVWGITIVLGLSIVFQLYYAHRMVKSGVLR